MSNKEPKLICPYPFGRLSASKKMFVPCCMSWLNSSLVSLKENEDPWNGEMAQLFRQKILDNDFSFCKRELCQEPLIDINKLEQSYISDDVAVSIENLTAAKLGKTEMPRGPSVWSFGGADNRCNLKCSSCREDYITTLSKRKRKEFISHFENLKKYKEDIEVLRFGDNGEVFFSPWLKRILKISTPKNFKNLKEIRVLSNGTLVTERLWKSLAPGTDNISQINISIDAGTKETYKKIRGGNFDNLLKNLQFLGTLRKEGKLKRFYINMTLQADNIFDLDNLAQFASENFVDSVIIHPILIWSMEQSTYDSKAIHLEGHPRHGDYLEVISKHRHNPIFTLKLPDLL